MFVSNAMKTGNVATSFPSTRSGQVWEHALRNETDYIRHVDYIHYNPVKHGWVTRVTDWQYSSFHWFVERVTYTPEWGTAVDLPYDFDKS
jgi:hypothetical protein